MSYLLRNERSLSYEQYQEVAKRLGYSQKEPSSIDHSCGTTNQEWDGEERRRHSGQFRSPEFVELSTSSAQSSGLSWLDLALADLTLLRSFQNDVSWISRTLGISPILCLEIVDKLLRLGVLVQEGENLRKVNEKIYLSANQSTESLRAYHRDALGKAIVELQKGDSVSYANRLITGASVTMSAKMVPEVKKRINNFIQEICDLASREEAESLYQINVQLLPIVIPSKK